MPVVTITRDNKYIATDVYQWDKNRILEIYGLTFDSLPEIHFYNGSTPEALVKQATIDKTGTIRVEIPNSLLEVAKPLNVYICFHNGEEFTSKYHITINVRGRVKPADYIAEDDEKIYSYNALENLVNETVINLERDQAAFHESMITEFEEFKTHILQETRDIIENTAIADANTLDGYHAEQFEFSGKGGRTVINSDGSITTFYDDGSRETVRRNEDGSFTTTRNTLELGVITETVKVNDDGSISVIVSEGV